MKSPVRYFFPTAPIPLYRACLLAMTFACAVLLSGPRKALSAPLFSGAIALEVGDYPAAIAGRDLNEDGIPDVVTANYNDNTISVVLNRGDTTSAERTDFATGAKPRALAVSDLNNDGHQDLLTLSLDLNSFHSAVTVLLGDGSGKFIIKSEYPAATSDYDFVVADLDGDGRQDIVTSSYGTTGHVLLGNGDGTFQAASGYGIGSAVSLAVGEVNGDGKLDLVVADVSDGVTVALGVGDGSFAPGIRRLTGFATASVAIADLNGDGRADIATANLATNTASILLGVGDGTFEAAASPQTGPHPVTVAISDLSGDGKADIVTANAYDGTVSVLLGIGDGTFRPRADYPVADQQVGDVVAADIDHDGSMDLAVSSLDTRTVVVLLGNGDGTFRVPVELATGNVPYGIAVGDMNGDGSNDILMADVSSHFISALPGNGDGTFGSRIDFPVADFPVNVVLADVNGDDAPDLVATSWSANSVSVLLSLGRGSFAAKVDYPVSNPFHLAVADLNSDGALDLLTANSPSSGEGGVSVLFGSGDGTFGAATTYPVSGFPVAIASGDMNADGLPDVAVSTGLSQYGIAVLLGKGEGFLGQPTYYPSAGFVGGVAVGDVNGDGRVDIVSPGADGYSGQGFVRVLAGNGDGTFTPSSTHQVGRLPFAVVIRDVNGDRLPDLITSNQQVNTVTVLTAKADGNFDRTDYVSTGKGQAAYYVAVEDVDGDGRPDMIVPSRVHNSVSILVNRGTFKGGHVAVDVDPNTVNLAAKMRWLTVYIEPTGFSPSHIDISTIRLNGTVAVDPKFGTIGDHDADGLPELMVKFKLQSLIPYLSAGKTRLRVTGRLFTGEQFEGAGEVQVMTTSSAPLGVSIAPNPLNPNGTLTFRTTVPGLVKLMIFDLQGRLVRTLIPSQFMGPGTHVVRIDGKGETRGELASGVYHYRLDTRDGPASGRFTLLK